MRTGIGVGLGPRCGQDTIRFKSHCLLLLVFLAVMYDRWLALSSPRRAFVLLRLECVGVL